MDYRRCRSDYRIEFARSLASSSSTHRKVAEPFDETIENLLEFLARDDHRLAIRRFRRPLAEEFNLGILGKVRVERIGAPGREKRFAVENGLDRFRHRARAGSHDYYIVHVVYALSSFVARRSCARASSYESNQSLCVSKKVSVSPRGKKHPGVMQCFAWTGTRTGPPPEERH